MQQAEHPSFFKCGLYNLFTHSFNVVLNRDIMIQYNTRSKDNVKLFEIETGVFELPQILLRTNGII